MNGPEANLHNIWLFLRLFSHGSRLFLLNCMFSLFGELLPLFIKFFGCCGFDKCLPAVLFNNNRIFIIPIEIE
jgi:hypothetical protein